VARIIEQIDAEGISIVRVHTAGDFYSPAYLARWLEIFRTRPEVLFFFYTRSWRVTGYRRLLVQAARLGNVRSWWSVDAGTGWPPKVPPRVRLAYLATRRDDDVGPVQLVFRTHALRRQPARWWGTVPICPAETGREKMTCERCGYCFSPPEGEKVRGRVALALVDHESCPSSDANAGRIQ
jgi:rubredoxin